MGVLILTIMSVCGNATPRKRRWKTSGNEPKKRNKSHESDEHAVDNEKPLRLGGSVVVPDIEKDLERQNRQIKEEEKCREQWKCSFGGGATNEVRGEQQPVLPPRIVCLKR